jgi:hypothetical protein
LVPVHRSAAPGDHRAINLLGVAVERNGDNGRLSSALVSLAAAQNQLDHMIAADDCVSFVDAGRKTRIGKASPIVSIMRGVLARPWISCS